MNPKRFLPIFIAAWLPLAAMAMSLSQNPLFIAATEPRVMLVASRDHQLSIKAYTDYSDLDGDGQLDTTYKDSITYFGYFDSGKCYTYANARFEPAAAVAANTHQCGGAHWSGNFLNWASMTRMDILRRTFYGGRRSTDDSGAGALTVLERQFLPNDVHAFVKVYNPGNAATLALYMPAALVGANTSVSLCNVSDSTDTDLTGTSNFSMPAPSIKVAAGTWPQWDSSEVTQCGVNIGNATQPVAVLGTYNARVKVCAAGMLESNCKTYTHPTTGVQTVKPTGLLQAYGDVDADRRVRFGLMTGSYALNKSGGVLRKNTSLIANNSGISPTLAGVCGDNHANDEIDVCTGRFINQAANEPGIINTLNRLRIAGFRYTAAGKNDKHRYSCDSPGIASFNNGECVDWGSPLSEIYLETLRYFANAGVTAGFNANDSALLASLPQVAWADPLPATEWCALSSIVVLSTGLNSFDTDQLASFNAGASAFDAAELTQDVGDAENINNGTYLIGNVIGGAGNNNQCTAKVLGNLANAKGICPEVPSTEGGYGIAGLAYGPKSLDLRPGYAANRASRWGGANPINADWALRQPINTYAVQLAESLPSFSAPVGAGTVTLLPACQANSAAGAAAWPNSAGWRNCSMTNLVVDSNVAMADVGTVVAPMTITETAQQKTCSGNGTTSQCFTVAWEDSTWGNDYDMDGIQRLGYCVGAACATFKMLCPSNASATATLGPWAGVNAGDIVIATCAAQAVAGHALTFGYTVTGSTNDGAFFPILRPGNSNFTVGQVRPAAVTAANPTTFTQGAAAAKLLKNPLWYAAKYGGFTESTPAVGTPSPDVVSEWDAVINSTGVAGADGDPDNYFDVKNPGNLITAMSTIFDAASQPDASAASVATNSTNLKIESRIYQARFSSADWSGQLLQFQISTDGELSPDEEWDAGDLLQNANGRKIITKGAADGVAFSWANLTAAQQLALNTNALAVNDGLGSDRVDYLRGTDSAAFRPRAASKLGDIVNSNPWYVGKPNAGYSDVDHPGYSAFRNAYANRTPAVYVGGNDGMLHGFDASLDFSDPDEPNGLPTVTSGTEVMAYVPSAVYGNLSRLSDLKYNKNHRYFVDGSPMIADADLDSTVANNWRTVLIGSLGAGGKGYFALDVTDPADYSEAGAAPANTLLWEFDETDMGNAFNMPPAILKTNQAKQVVKLANGKWAAVVGNGFNSAAGKAVLYVLFIEDGIDGTWAVGDYVKIVADAPLGQDNGLATPVPFDSDGDGYADTVYAGDLKGNLWKFLIGPNASVPAVNANPNTWRIAFSTSNWDAGTFTLTCNPCAPLFQARNDDNQIQPITWPPEVTLHPDGGQMVLFGTGKYLESSDNSSNQVQSFYGIRDWHDGATTVGTRAADLLEQTVELTVLDGVNFRTPSDNPISLRGMDCVPPYADNCNVGTHMGWYMDLPTSGERLTGIPKLESGTVFFNTFIPSTSPCEAGGTGWFMTLDFLDGSLLAFPMFDTDGDGDIDANDDLVGGLNIGAALGGTTLIQGVGASPLGVGVSSLTSGSMNTTLINFGAGSRGRITWREIVQ